jgi:DNA-binding transcriptional MerR regulator
MSGGVGSHLSIGEVLNALQTDFPDVTVSKIRFLESQGLINPERTPSGYRKFYASDVARLRWILTEQRDHYMPLKVIKERLEAHDPANGELPPPTPPPETPMAPPEDTPPTPPEPTPRPAAVTTPPSSVAPAPAAASAPAEPGPADGPLVRRRVRDMTLPLVLDGEAAADDDEGPDTFDRVALARAADVTEAILDELESYGVIKPFHDDGIRAFYDRDALVCVQAAGTLAKHGVQPRHLKMYVHFTEREAALFHQVLAPYLRQRNPVSRAKVDETLSELVTEVRTLRGALLRRAIEDALGE